MADTLTSEQRHRCMSHIRSKNTRPELLVRKYLFAKGFRFRVNRRDLPGKPDIVLPKYRTVVFVNGCFWHGHDSCRYATIPATNTAFWMAKINGNRERDALTQRKLEELGWRVIVVWQCQLKADKREATLAALPELIKMQR